MDWKSTEKNIAKFLGGERVPITGRIGKPDVEHVEWAIEVKARTNMPKWVVAIMEYLKRETYLYFEFQSNRYLCTSLSNLNTVLGLTGLPTAQTITRKKVVGWLDYGLNQAILCTHGEKIPVTILHQKYWKYTDSVCLVPISYLEE